MMAPDRFGMLLGIGIITGITVQALFNISVVTSILPAKGIPRHYFVRRFVGYCDSDRGGNSVEHLTFHRGAGDLKERGARSKVQAEARTA